MVTTTGDTHRPTPITLPDPASLRARLAECIRETATLRSLLRIAERDQRQATSNRKAAAHAG